MAYLPLGFVQQRLTITRNESRAVPVFRNGNRQRALGEWMIKRSLQDVAGANNPYLKWSTTLAHYLSMDYDALSALQRDEELGMVRYRDPFYVRLLCDARSTPHLELRLHEKAPTFDHVPPHYPALQRRLLAVLDMHALKDDEIHARLIGLRYPQANVLKEIEDLKKFIEQPITRQFKDIVPLSHTILRCRRDGGAAPPEEDAMDLDAPQPAPATVVDPRSLYPDLLS